MSYAFRLVEGTAQQDGGQGYEKISRLKTIYRGVLAGVSEGLAYASNPN
jgi:hypothetical protein